LRGINQSQEFVHFEAFRNVVQQALELQGRFFQVTGFILGYCRLEQAI